MTHEKLKIKKLEQSKDNEKLLKEITLKLQNLTTNGTHQKKIKKFQKR